MKADVQVLELPALPQQRRPAVRLQQKLARRHLRLLILPERKAEIDQREAHAVGTHGNAIAHPDGVETHADESCRGNALLHLLGEAEKVHVAGVAFEPDTGDAHLGLLHVLFGESGAVEHRLGCALRLGLGDA